MLALAACGSGRGQAAATGSEAPATTSTGTSTTVPAEQAVDAAPAAPTTGPCPRSPSPGPIRWARSSWRRRTVPSPSGTRANPGSEAGHAKATYDLRTYLTAADQGKVPDDAVAPFTMEAYTELPAAEPEGQPFPLVLFSHGFCGYRQQSSFLTTTIASWGFVVAAPTHRSRPTSCLSGTIGQGTSARTCRTSAPQSRSWRPRTSRRTTLLAT